MLALSFCCLHRWHALGTLFFWRDTPGGDSDADPEASGGCESAADGAMWFRFVPKLADMEAQVEHATSQCKQLTSELFPLKRKS